jgi:hypothetical protein
MIQVCAGEAQSTFFRDQSDPGFGAKIFATLKAD